MHRSLLCTPVFVSVSISCHYHDFVAIAANEGMSSCNHACPGNIMQFCGKASPQRYSIHSAGKWVVILS